MAASLSILAAAAGLACGLSWTAAHIRGSVGVIQRPHAEARDMGVGLQPQDLAQILSPPPDLASAIPLAMVILLTLAVIPAVLAHMKGHSPVLWYLYGCVFLPTAFVQSLFLANRKRRQADLISQADELERWARLRDRELLTQAEFDQKKRQLLQTAPGTPSLGD